MINPGLYLVGKICHEADAESPPLMNPSSLRYHFFRNPSPLWQPAIALRYAVFVDEQKVPEEMEVDACDDAAHHLLVLDGEHDFVGVMRIVVKGKAGKIGRVAVARAWRRRGVGGEMMLRALDYCRTLGLESVTLDAQSYITGFYQRLGFVQEGEPFMDAGIPHVRMTFAIAT